ncbi:multicopper oxidase [Oidiodendron maius Zn]|uniref:Multicopper oxidase n=1 Tax=Oidiodendron maius (strain Zn) TaxID=913774 RepID=A0A0C3DBE1_OIDMZ|nr:multicopper oxidase [Oidiodendron maius Zn]
MFALSALLLSSLLLFTLTYGGSHFGLQAVFQFHGQGSQEESDYGADLAIALHRDEHALREPRIVSHHWKVTKGYRSPDGVRKLVYLINDEFPGPTLETRSGDTLVIEVSNLLQDEGVSLHWHGLHMKGANEMDGAVGITQTEIAPGSEFTYNFQIDHDQEGSFWYHSHSELQRADGLYGGLIVHGPVEIGHSEHLDLLYDDEALLMIGDWYHRTAEEVQASYVTHESWGREPVPDSLLINGRGSFDCSMAVKSRPLNCTFAPIPVLVPKHKRSRLRVINVGTLSGFTVAIRSTQMTVMEIDGGSNVEPVSPSSAIGILYPGERMDILVEWPREGNEFNFTVILDTENYIIPNKALSSTQHFPIFIKVNSRLMSRGHPYTPSPATSIEGTFDLSTLNGTSTPIISSAPSEETILLYTKMEVLAHLGNVPAGFINRTSWAPQSDPLISLPRHSWDKNQLVPQVPMSTEKEAVWVDIIVNNMDEKGHPFHLHGYHFYVLAQYYPERRGFNAYNPFEASTPKGGPLNLSNPRMKDTVFIPAQGYVALRIHTDNPGIWFFHCHVLWHSGTGMAMAIQVGGE